MAKKSMMEQLAAEKEAYEKRVASMKEGAISELMEEWTAKTTGLQALADQLEELGKPMRFSIGGASGKKGSSGPKSDKPTFTGDASTVVAFIKSNAGEEGVSTRGLTSEFGKANWEMVLDGKAKKTGKGRGQMVP